MCSKKLKFHGDAQQIPLLVQALTTDPDPRVLDFDTERILAPWTLQRGFRYPAHSQKFVYCLLGDKDTFGQTNTHN